MSENKEQKVIQLTDKQLKELLADKQTAPKENILAKGYVKVKDTLDTHTRGVDGSVFSIARTTFKLIISLLQGVREAILTMRKK